MARSRCAAMRMSERLPACRSALPSQAGSGMLLGTRAPSHRDAASKETDSSSTSSTARRRVRQIRVDRNQRRHRPGGYTAPARRAVQPRSVRKPALHLPLPSHGPDEQRSLDWPFAHGAARVRAQLGLAHHHLLENGRGSRQLQRARTHVRPAAGSGSVHTCMGHTARACLHARITTHIDRHTGSACLRALHIMHRAERCSACSAHQATQRRHVRAQRLAQACFSP